MRIKQRIHRGSILSSLESLWQVEHPYNITDPDGTWGAYGLELPRLEPVEVPKEHAAWPYLGSRCRDAGVFELTVATDSVAFRINDLAAWTLAHAYGDWLQEKKGLQIRLPEGSFYSPALPVSLRFEQVSGLAFYTNLPSGKFARLKHSLPSNLGKVDRFGTDHVLEFKPESIVMLLTPGLNRCRETWHERIEPTGERLLYQTVHNLYLAIHARHLTVQEHQHEAWTAIFGAEASWIWEEFSRARRDNPYWEFDALWLWLDDLHR